MLDGYYLTYHNHKGSGDAFVEDFNNTDTAIFENSDFTPNTNAKMITNIHPY